VNRVACGEEHEGRIVLRRLGDGRELDGSDPFDSVLVSRLDCDVRVVEIPPVPEREVHALLRYRLRSLYPGSSEETVIDHRLIGDGRALLLIMRRDILELYRRAAGRRRLLLPFELFERQAGRRDALRVWFLAGSWQEHLVFRRGAVESSGLYRADGDTSELRPLEQGIPPETLAIPALYFASAAEPTEPPPGALVVSAADLHVGSAAGVFRERRRGLSWGLRVLALASLAALLGLLVLYRFVGTVERRAEALRQAAADLQAVSARILLLQDEIGDLERSIGVLEARRPLDVYAALSAVGRTLGGEATIESLVLRGGAFQIEAVASDPLGIMERFRRSESFEEAKLSQVVPDPRTGAERFSFSGSFRGKP